MLFSFLPRGRRLLQALRKKWGVRQNPRYEPVPRWANYSAADIQRVERRLQRFSDEYLKSYREGGLMRLPLRHTVRNGAQICVEKRALPGAALPPDQVHTLPPQEIDLVFKSLLMQLRQLESLQFVHGAIRGDTVRVHKPANAYVAAVTDISAARFRDEPPTAENLSPSLCMTPEACRMQRYPYAAQIAPETDVYSAGCLYYQYLTGRELTVGASPLSPSEAACVILPVPIEGVYGFRASLIRWMLAPYQSDRPTADQVLAAFAEAEENRLTAAALPGAFDCPGLHVCAEAVSPRHSPLRRLAFAADGTPCQAQLLPWMWPCGSSPKTPLTQRQRQYLTRAAARLSETAQLSRDWHAAHPGIDPCAMVSASPWPLCSAPFGGDVCIPLEQLKRYDPSIFLLDARMTELLFMAQVLHSGDYILGIFSEQSFYASIGEDGAQAHYADAAFAISLFSIPPAIDFMPDAAALRLMSPEMSTFISSQSPDQEEAYQLHLGPASDIFTLGFLYHLILTGHFPQVDESRLNGGPQAYGTFSNAICHASDPAAAIVLDPSLDRKHSLLIRRMISLNPLDRPASCEEIAYTIMRFYTE